MNATRAATIRLRSLLRRRRLARARADADARDHRAPRGGDPRLQARALLAGRRALRGPRWPTADGAPSASTTAATTPAPSRALASEEQALAIVAGLPRAAGHDHQGREAQAARAAAAAVRPHVAAARRQHPLRLLRRRTLAAAQRLYEEHKALTYPRTSSRFLTADMVPRSSRPQSWSARAASTRKAAAYVTGLDLLPLARVVNDAKVTDHHAIIPTRAEHNAREDGRRRPAHLRPGRAALPGRVPPRGRVREHARRDTPSPPRARRSARAASC